MPDIPPGFTALNTNSPFNNLLGPYYCQLRDGGLVIGLRVEERHCNTGGKLHGGMVPALADIALGHNIGLALAAGREPGAETPQELARGVPGAPIATVSMSTDYAGTATRGDWIEAHADVQKAGRSLAFANAYLMCGDERIARVSAVFRVFR